MAKQYSIRSWVCDAYKLMNVLVTGCAGFICFKIFSKLLLNKNLKVFGIDNINDYYDQKLKKDRLNILKDLKIKFYKFNICDKKN